MQTGSRVRLAIDECKHLDVVVQGVDEVDCPTNCVDGIDNVYTKTINAYVSNFDQICDKRFIKVAGLIDDVMLVNYEVLYMSTINAVKYLNQELNELKKKSIRRDETITSEVDARP